MSKGFKHGAGGVNLLNFEVVGNYNVKENPKKTTVWIHTDEEITCWHFSFKEPAAPVPGMVWIRTYANETCVGQFDALRKENCIEVYPQAAYQYIDGAWVGKPAQVWKGEAWVDWDFWVFKSGTGLCGGVTGFSNVDCTADSISGTLSDSRPMDSNETIDVTAYSTAHFSGVSCTAKNPGGTANSSGLGLYVGSKYTSVGSSNSSGSKTYCENADFIIDISDISGAVNFGADPYSNGGIQFVIEIKNIWFT